MKRRTYLSATTGALLTLTGCLDSDEADRAWDLNIKNKSGKGVSLTATILDNESEVVSRVLELDTSDEWTLETDYGEIAPVEVIIDIKNGVKKEGTWEDPDGANPLIVDINSTQKIEFIQGTG